METHETVVAVHPGCIVQAVRAAVCSDSSKGFNVARQFFYP